MKKQKLFLVALVLFICMFLCGCAISKKNRGATLNIDMTKSFVSEPLEMQGMKVTPLCTVDNGIIVAHYDKNGKGRYYLYDIYSNKYTEFHKNRKENPTYTGQLSDGNYIFLYNNAIDRRGGMDILDDKQRSAEIFDLNCQCIQEFDLPEETPVGFLNNSRIVMMENGDWFFLSQSDSSKTGYVTRSNDVSEYYILNPDFTIKKYIDFRQCYVERMVVGASGSIYGIDRQLDENITKVYKFDFESLKMDYLERLLPATACSVMDGKGSYELFYTMDDAIRHGIYGVKTDGTVEEIVDFNNSDLPDSVGTFYLLQDGSFVLYYTDAESNFSGWCTLRQRTNEEIENTKLISLAGVNISPKLVQEVCAYNKTHINSHIIIKDYGREWAVNDSEVMQEILESQKELRSPNLDFTPALEEFKKDLLNGTVPDIICMDNIPYQLLSNKGILTDLMPLLKTDERYDDSLYLSNILHGLKHGEKLERIGFSFTVNTIVAKSEYVGNKQSLSAEEYSCMLHNVQNKTDLFWTTDRDELIQIYLINSQGSFIDKEKMSCHFDTTAFINLLKLINSFPSESMINENQNKKNALFYPFQISRPIDYHSLHYQTFNNADITLVGFPETGDGNGGMFKMDYTIALNSQSNNETIVIDFILTELEPQRQSKVCVENSNYCSLPILHTALENALLAATRGVHNGGNLNEQEMILLRNYIDNVMMYQEIDPEVTKIILEETEKYFVGDCSAETAANNIQKRVKLYLSERV